MEIFTHSQIEGEKIGGIVKGKTFNMTYLSPLKNGKSVLLTDDVRLHEHELDALIDELTEVSRLMKK